MWNKPGRCLPGKFILCKTGGTDENNNPATEKLLALNGVCLPRDRLLRHFLCHERKK
jgi:hypothetical protein